MKPNIYKSCTLIASRIFKIANFDECKFEYDIWPRQTLVVIKKNSNDNFKKTLVGDWLSFWNVN